MTDSEARDIDIDVAEKFFAGIRSYRVTNDDIKLVADDPETIRMLSYMIRDTLPSLRAQSIKKLRNEHLLMNVRKLELDVKIAEKLIDGLHGKVFRLAMASRKQLASLGLDDEEITQVVTSLESIDLEIREEGVELPEQLLRLWHTWNAVPTPVRVFYGI